LGQVRRRPRRQHRHALLWRLGPAEGPGEEVRLHGRPRSRRGARAAQNNAAVRARIRAGNSRMTSVERALELVPHGARSGLGPRRAAQAFVRALGERVRSGRLRVQGVPTSNETADLARKESIPLIALTDSGTLDLTVDGADEVDPHLDLIKGYGRAMVREKV